MPAIPLEKPSIHLLYAHDCGDEALFQLRHGMEEEGIPWKEDGRLSEDAIELAWEAAQASRLDVGIGLTRDLVVLHFAKLLKEVPLFCISRQADLELVRMLGANAARLVKKMPLKSQDRR